MGIGEDLNELVRRVEELERRIAQKPTAQTLPTPEDLRITARVDGDSAIAWTPELLAEELHTNPETIVRIERGAFRHQRQCTWMMVDLIAAKLKVPQETYRLAVVRVRNEWLKSNARRSPRAYFGRASAREGKSRGPATVGSDPGSRHQRETPSGECPGRQNHEAGPRR